MDWIVTFSPKANSVYRFFLFISSARIYCLKQINGLVQGHVVKRSHFYSLPACFHPFTTADVSHYFHLNFTVEELDVLFILTLKVSPYHVNSC